MRIVVQGVSHRTAPLDVRERAALLPEELPDALTDLRSDGSVAELAVLSTCNRTEFYAIAADPEAAVDRQREFLRARKGVDLAQPGVAYVHTQEACVGHLFRVAAGIDSMVLGETAILSQVKTAYEAASHGDSVGPIFARLFSTALHVGKRSRSETTIGQGAASLEKSAVQVAEKVFDNLSGKSGLIVGAGDSGDRVATLLCEAGLGSLAFANRTRSKAEELAALHGGRAVELGAIGSHLPKVDIVVTAVGSREPVLRLQDVKQALDSRRRGPLLILDLGVPRNVDPEIAKIGSVFLYAVDDLQELVELNLDRRRREVPAVEAIVEQEKERFLRWLLSLRTTPVVVAMREEADRIRRETLDRFGKGLPADQRELLDRFSSGLMQKLLHEPTVAVRECDPETHEGLRGLHWAQRLFGLNGEGTGRRRR